MPEGRASRAAHRDRWRRVCDRALEGVVAKRVGEPYRPGEQRWLKINNRAYWRYPLEVEAVRRKTGS